MVYQWLFNHLSGWLPQTCCLCGRDSRPHAICSACLQDLPRFSIHSCHQCGRPLSGAGPAAISCGQCQRRPPAYDRVIAGFAYAEPVSQLVGQLKFHGRLQLARLLGELLAERVGRAGSSAEAILPVPLHPHRLRERGFNQALEITRPLSRALKLPILRDAVIRNRHTQPQSAQATERRRHNVRGAFSLKRVAPYHCVAIVDDVMTSGHTVNEIAQLLRRAGVERMEVWCVARAWSHQDQK